LQFKTLSFESLHFPKTEWQWLRPPAHFAESEPDTFLWGAEVNGQIWAWHPKGADLSNGFAGMQCRVLVLAAANELEAHGLYLKTSFAAQPAHDVEWTTALDVAATRLGFNAAERGLGPHWAKALEACGLEPHLGALAQRARYQFLTHEERKLLFDKRWDLATFELLETLRPELRALFVNSARNWNLSANQAKEAVNFVLMLDKKFGEKTAQKILSTQFKNAEEFRETLLTTAQPELAALSRKRIERLRALKLPPRTSVFGDPSFEKDILKITHNPRTIADFEIFKSWIEDPELAQKMRELLEIYQ
jgi:hypothetical protein